MKSVGDTRSALLAHGPCYENCRFACAGNGRWLRYRAFLVERLEAESAGLCAELDAARCTRLLKRPAAGLKHGHAM